MSAPTRFDARQSVLRSALPMVGTSANAGLDSVLTSIDPELSKLFEDRNIILVDGGTITFPAAGTSVTFSTNLKLHINSQVAGGTPTTIDLGSTTRTLSANNKMVYAVINRTGGTASVTDDSSTLPAVTSANQEVVLLAKRVDSGDGTKRVYFRGGFSLSAGQSSRLGTTGTIYASEFAVVDATDTTKKVILQASGAATATTTTLIFSQTVNRQITFPDATDTLVARATTDSLSNKQIAYSVTTDSTTSGADATIAAFTTGIVRLTNGSLSSVGGIPAGTSGQFLILENQTGIALSVNDNDGSATAANRIRTGTGANVPMPINATFEFTYDSTASRWMLTGGSGSGTTSSGINYITNGTAETDTSGWSTFSSIQTATFVDTTANITVGSSSGMYVGQPVVFTTTEGIQLIPSAGTGPFAFGSHTSPSGTFYIVSIIGSVIQVSNFQGGPAVTWSATVGAGGNGAQWVRPLTPTTYTGGSVFDLTFSRSTSSPLRGTGSFLLTQAAANLGSIITLTSISNGSPAVFTTPTSHLLSINQMIWLRSSTDTLPTGLSFNVPYYIVSANFTSNTFSVSATVGGSPINTSSAGSGTHHYRAEGCVTSNGVSFPFTVDNEDQAKSLSIQVDFNADSVFSPSDGITAPNVGGSGDSDIEFYVWDVTNNSLVFVSPQVITANGANNFTFKGIFQTASNSTSYALLVYSSKAEQSNTAGWNFKFDNVSVGPQVILQGPPATDWVSFTPTGSFTTNTTYTGRYRRVGDSLDFDVALNFSGAPNSTTMTVNLPPGFTIDTNKLANGVTTDFNNKLDGSIDIFIGSGWTGPITPTSTTAIKPYWMDTNGNANFVTQASPASIVASNVIILTVRGVPIVGWSSTTVMSNDTDTRVVAMFTSGQPTGTLSGSFNVTKYPAASSDTHGGYNASTGIYTVPVSGFYDIIGSSDISASWTDATEGVTIGIQKNATTVVTNLTLAVATSTTDYQAVVTANSVKCSAGDTIQIVTAEGGSGATYFNSSLTNYFSISRRSGPSAISAIDSIIASYNSAAGQSIANGVTSIINFDTKSVDTTSSVTTGANWKFTAPVSGKYRMNASILWNTATFTAGNATVLGLYKNGSLFRQLDFEVEQVTFSTTPSNRGSSIISLIAGDFIDVRASHGEGTSRSLIADATYIYIDIERIGN